MPAPLRAWYSLRDIEMLAARNAVISGKIQLDELTRLSGLIEASNAAVEVRLSFESRGDGWQALELRYAADVAMVCQRCLESMSLHIEGSVGFGIVAGLSWEEMLPGDVEPIVMDDERLCPMKLVEDELIVSLPLSPRHGNATVCADPIQATAS